MHERDRALRIRDLNDALRKHGRDGRTMVTRGLASLGEGDVRRVLRAVADFDDFSDDNDPWGEHDCAVMMVGGRRIIWKIDYYDLSLRYHSPDPTDPAVTVRVLTVMCAEEY
jgi:hypothetical protein